MSWNNPEALESEMTNVAEQTENVDAMETE
jgi:hypothetical protein